MSDHTDDDSKINEWDLQHAVQLVAAHMQRATVELSQQDILNQLRDHYWTVNRARARIEQEHIKRATKNADGAA